MRFHLTSQRCDDLNLVFTCVTLLEYLNPSIADARLPSLFYRFKYSTLPGGEQEGVHPSAKVRGAVGPHTYLSYRGDWTVYLERAFPAGGQFVATTASRTRNAR